MRSSLSSAPLAEFLRASRARVRPADVGLPDDGRPRRVPGLRREELAQLANVSVDYVVRLEQGRATGVSRSVLEALADALALDDAGREYLMTVAGPPSPRAASRRRSAPKPATVPPATLRVLDALQDVPAMVIGRCGDVLAWNALAAALIIDFGRLEPSERNMTRLAFLEPSFRTLYAEWERVAQDCVASLRMEAAQDPDDPRVAELVGELSVKSPEFARWWGDHRVRGSESRTKTYNHPVAGPMTLDVQRLAVAERRDLKLVVYTAAPESEAGAALRFLAGWA